MPSYGSGSTMSGLAELMSISLLKPSAVEQEGPVPPRPDGGQGGGVEAQGQLVPRSSHHERVVGRREERPHVAFPRVAARHRLPRRPPRDPRVVEPKRLPLRRHGGEATLAEIGAHGIEDGGCERHVGRRGGDRGLVPVDPQGRDHPDVPRGTDLPFLMSTTTVCGLPTGIPTCSTAVTQLAVGALDLEPRRHHGEAHLVRGDVVAREGVVGPAGEEQHRVRDDSEERSRVSACSFA